MKRLLCIFLILFMGIQVVSAQTRQVSGTVTSADDNSPLPGVSVIVKGTTIGVTTDLDGKYQLNVPEGNNVLQFSFIGMKAQEVEITGSTINVVLQQDMVGVDEVMVVAYGTKTKRAITGAISNVGPDVIENQIALSPVRAIQGAAAGVNVITTGGQPGENPTIRIRGIGSANADAQPLIVVDGVTFSGNLNTISSNQIKTINILKDASASALYGSRAANGVLLITTKGGQYGERKAKISVNARAGLSSAAVKGFDLVGAADYMKYGWESMRNNALYSTGMSAADAATYATNNLIADFGYNPLGVNNPVGTDGEIVSGANLLWDTDWYGEMIQDNALYNEVTFSAEGGTNELSYFASGNYTKQEGTVVGSDFQRFSGRVNLQSKLTDWMEFGSNNAFSKSIQNFPNQEGNGFTNTMQWIYSIASIYPVFARDENGDFRLDNAGNKIYDYGNTQGQTVNATRIFAGDNALASTKNHDRINHRTSLFSTSFIKLKFHETLSFKSVFGYENYLFDKNDYTHYLYGHAAGVGGRVDHRRDITENLSFTNSLSYKNSFGEHSIGADVISEVIKFKFSRLRAQGTGFLPNIKVLAGSTLPESVDGYVNEERLVSYLGRVDYSYKSKYYLDISFRRDASTRFADGERWGSFYSVGGSWIISDEAFIKNLSPKIDLLKLRASYGELGNKGILDEDNNAVYFPYLASYFTGWNEGENTGVLKGGIVDPYLSWEKTAMFSVALDFGFFNNRLSGTVEYYNRESVDLLFDQPLAPSLGSTEFTTNVGDMRNRGFEFTLNSVNLHTKDIHWTSSLNLSTFKNELLKLPQDEIFDGSKKLRVGKSIYEYFIREYAGVDPDTGDALWYMDSGDPVVDAEGNTVYDNEGRIVYDNYEKVTTNDYDEADRYYQGSSLPTLTGGFSNYFKYKNFDINAQFTFSFGGKILDYTYAGLMNSLSRPGDQLSVDIANRWQQPGDITDVPKLTSGNNDYNGTSTRFLFDNDFIRLKALTVGYNLPVSLVKRIGMANCRVYLQADNIWTYQSHKGIDPEQNMAGTTNDRSGQWKTYSLGINIGF